MIHKKIMVLLAPDTTGNTGGTGTTPSAEQNQAAPQNVSIPQAQLDALFAERAKRGGEAAVNEILTKLGVKSVDELTDAITTAKKISEAQLSEAEKTAQALKAAEERAAKAEQEKANAIQQATERLLKAEVMAEASRQGFRPEAIADVFLVADRSKVTEKDGVFSGIKEAVEAVAKEKPFWLATTTDPKKISQGTPKPPVQRKPDAEQEPPKRAALRL